MKIRHLSAAVLLCSLLILVGCASSRSAASSEGRQVGIIAHRGYWNCPEGEYAQNSVASLRAAQQAGFWGSEFDVQLTSDSIVVSNHDKQYGPAKMVIAEHTYAQLAQYPLPNGEKLPTLDDYLLQGEKCASTVLVLEVKKQKSDASTALLVDLTLDILQKHSLLDPSRVIFISFSRLACERLIAKCPGFQVQYLTGNLSSSKLSKLGYSGADYFSAIFFAEPSLIGNLHRKGLSANAWTVDKPSTMNKLFKKGVDFITTNDPMEARELLADRELTLQE